MGLCRDAGADFWAGCFTMPHPIMYSKGNQMMPLEQQSSNWLGGTGQDIVRHTIDYLEEASSLGWQWYGIHRGIIELTEEIDQIIASW